MNPSIQPNYRKQHGSIHRIREFELEKVNLSDEFDILQIVGEGWFGKILLVEHRATDTEMVLKALPKPYVSLRDFYREFHYGLYLGAHKNIVTTYDVAFETAGFYVFTQEYAPLGDLTSNVSDIGIGESNTKRVAKQIASALDYMHAKDLVHRDVKLDNVLVYRSDFSRVKLCDFGETRKAQSYVQRRNEWLPYSPPEVLQIPTDQTYRTVPSHDFWQFGIVLFVCLTGCLPWQKAAPDDPRYVRYLVWQSSSLVIPIKRTPKLFKLLTNRACKLFRKFLEPNPDRRPKNLNDLQKFLDDRWLAKNAEKDMIANEPDELCASMYSFHSSPEEKNKLLFALSQHGIETTVDRMAKKKRIRDWIQESVIQEDDEEGEEEDEEEDDGENVEPLNHRAPVAGHVSTVRAQEKAAQPKIPRKQIVSTVKSAENKHINPRTGQIQQGPSQMGNHASDHGSPERCAPNVTPLERCAPNVTPPERMPRKSTKLIDVGSQTSNDSQKLREAMAANGRTATTDREYAPAAAVAATAPGRDNERYSYTQSTQTAPNEMNGLSDAFHSMSAATKGERMPSDARPQPSGRTELRYRDRSQPRHTYHHRTQANAAALSRQPMSRSMHNFNSSLINDSGYGSLDKLRPVEPTMSLLSSPTLLKRTVLHDGNREHELSDSGGESPFGSNGFVNCVDRLDMVQRRPTKPASMKDTVYDRNIYGRRKT